MKISGKFFWGLNSPLKKREDSDSIFPGKKITKILSSSACSFDTHSAQKILSSFSRSAKREKFLEVGGERGKISPFLSLPSRFSLQHERRTQSHVSKDSHTNILTQFTKKIDEPSLLIVVRILLLLLLTGYIFGSVTFT
jgi:hypothetical protein